MNDKEAIKILTNLLKNPLLSKEEKEAILNAIGILGWSKLAESRIDRLKIRRKKNI